MRYDELLERMEKAGLITKNDYHTTIDLATNSNSFGNSIVVTDKTVVTKKTHLTTLEIYALRYAAINLQYQGDELMDLDDSNNAIQDSTLRLDGFEGYPIDEFYGHAIVVDCLFVGDDNHIYCEVWVDPNNYLLIVLT